MTSAYRKILKWMKGRPESFVTTNIPGLGTQSIILEKRKFIDAEYIVISTKARGLYSEFPMIGMRIYKGKDTCYIEYISRTRRHSGEKVLIGAEKFAKRLGIRKAILSDMSFLICNDNKIDYRLITIMKHGRTFYDINGYKIETNAKYPTDSLDKIGDYAANVRDFAGKLRKLSVADVKKSVQKMPLTAGSLTEVRLMNTSESSTIATVWINDFLSRMEGLLSLLPPGNFCERFTELGRRHCSIYEILEVLIKEGSFSIKGKKIDAIYYLFNIYRIMEEMRSGLVIYSKEL